MNRTGSCNAHFFLETNRVTCPLSKMQADSLDVVDTEHSACSVAACPSDRSLFACGLYQVVKQQEPETSISEKTDVDDDDEEQSGGGSSSSSPATKRLGRCLLMRMTDSGKMQVLVMRFWSAIIPRGERRSLRLSFKQRRTGSSSIGWKVLLFSTWHGEYHASQPTIPLNKGTTLFPSPAIILIRSNAKGQRQRLAIANAAGQIIIYDHEKVGIDPISK